MLIHMWDKEIKHMEAKNLRDCTEAEKIHARMMENKRMDIKVLQEEARLMALKVQLAQLSSGAAVVLTNSSPSLLSLNCHSFCPRFFHQHWQFTYHCHEYFSHLIPMFIILMHPTPGPASLNDIFSPTCASLHIYFFTTCTLLFYPLSTTHSLFFFDSIVVVLHVVQHLYKYIWYFCSHNPCLCTSLSINNLWNCWPSPQLLLVSPGGHLLFPTTQPLPSLPRPLSHLPTHPSATLQGELPCSMLCKIIQHIIQYMATCKLLFFLIWRWSSQSNWKQPFRAPNVCSTLMQTCQIVKQIHTSTNHMYRWQISIINILLTCEISVSQFLERGNTPMFGGICGVLSLPRSNAAAELFFQHSAPSWNAYALCMLPGWPINCVA